ncbi:aspartyl protease family protein [Hibiscus syriacus]|uniref:Aspartyl protease family protein n=1 Tax=Hibiscus syriacus TaxID=106335 RepID=A0A6A3AAC4_HIBSY|nr:aspartyl protease family protein [Hibiscus syriacus]
MRAGRCTMQQALTNEAANVVKQAVTLGRRRGHAQVTPLHVANTMLSTSTGLLRTACIQSQSHSHPLQCRALELCFNVALNRLPTSSSSPMLGAHSQYPSISNALVAAFKRAQAHQRRGSIENQQQPLLAVKIELEQLIISILDDPSVSRVMREAGFSSRQVKSNVEQAVSLEICSQSAPSVNRKSKESSNTNLVLSQSPTASQVANNKSGKPRGSDPIIRDEDVMFVIENLMNDKRRSFVVVGECVSSIGVLNAVIDKADKGNFPQSLRDAKFVNLSFSSFVHLNRVEISNGLLSIGQVQVSKVGGYYCPVEHMIMEVGKLLVSDIGESGRFKLMGFATFQTYMRCKSGHPSLETVWGLHPLTVPAGILRFSLITDSDLQSRDTSKKVENGSSWWVSVDNLGYEKQQLSCCADCSTKFENEVRSLQSTACNNESTTSSLPPWCKPYKDDNGGLGTNDKDSAPVRELCKKWNSFCNSVHKLQPYSLSERTHTFSSLSPPSSTSCFSNDKQYPHLQPQHHDWPVVEDRQSWRDHHFWISETVEKTVDHTSALRLYIPEHNYKDLKPYLSSNPNSTPNSASSSDVMETEYVHKFKELNAENLTTLCSALEKKVPWQKDIVPEIVSTILKCRSGMIRRKWKLKDGEPKEETWLFFQGVDVQAKEKIAKELARLVFGSQNNFVSIELSSFSSKRADSTEDRRSKRSREEKSYSYIDRFSEAVSSNPHRVFFIEDIEQSDYTSQLGFKRAIERGRISKENGEEAILSDAIIILSCESFSSRSRVCFLPGKIKSDGSSEEEKVSASEETTGPRVSLDLNMSIDDDSLEEQSIHYIGLLESVDRRIVFKIQEL